MKKAFLIIILLAAALRAIYFFQINDNFLFKEPILDAKYYHTWALEIDKGDWLGLKRGVFMMSPGYSYFLASIYTLSTDNIKAAVLVQFLAGLLSGVLIFLITKRFYGINAGLFAMTLFLFYGLEIFYESTLLKAVILNLANLTSFFLLTTTGIPAMFFAGIALGFSVHLRPNVLAFVPVVLLWLFLKHPAKYRAITFFLIGIFIMLFPIGVRNYCAGGEFVFSTAHGGMNFFTGNSPFCKGPYTPMPFARTDPEVEQADFLSEATKLSGKNLTPKQSSDFWFNQSFNYIKNSTSDWLTLTGKKALIFFNSFEPSINLDYYFFKKEYSSVLSLPLFNYGLIMPLALCGLIFLPFNLLGAGYLFVYFAANVAFFVVSEYRFPVVPIMCVFAGAFAEALYNKFSLFPTIKKVFVTITLIALVIFANFDIYSKVFGFNTYKQANLANSYFAMGVTYEDKGMRKEAIDTYEKAIAIMPQSAPMVNLANLYDSMGQLDKALALYEQAVRSNPNSVEAVNNLGSVLYKKGNYPAAYECFKRALYLKPDFVQAQNNMRIAFETIENTKKGQGSRGK